MRVHRCAVPCNLRPVQLGEPSHPGNLKRQQRRLTNLIPILLQFRAISNGLYGSEDHHALVRANVVAHMRQHKADFESFLGETWHQYITDMSHDGTWGDELTLVRFCRRFGDGSRRQRCCLNFQSTRRSIASCLMLGDPGAQYRASRGHRFLCV